ncbi:hypothetical protein [Paracoccus binzhouensis]|uniref:hypothetical protein n=1 Tax=Paracoccus binzhouensis TaxID=2796149 RepID=UPI0018EECCA9|nr:hypothetical protein [Paracoccus binzhouensis]
MRRFPALSDPRLHGSLQLKLEGHDSRPVRAGGGLSRIERDAFARHVERDFPFLDMEVIASLLEFQGPASAGGRLPAPRLENCRNPGGVPGVGPA